MSWDAEQVGRATNKFHSVESDLERKYIHEYEAILTEADKPIRIITLSPEFADNDAAIDAFERVSGQWYNVNTHPNTISIIEREATPRPWIAVEQHQEPTLDQVQSRLTPIEIEAVITDTAEALRTLGLYNAVHGMLSPEDITVVRDDSGTTAQVGGFGLNYAVRAALGESKPTSYMAPELLDNAEHSIEQTDVYGLGAITYFALTGQTPVDGSNIEQAICDGPSHPPSEHADKINPALDDCIMRALSTYPGDRQDSPHAFKRAFLSTFDADELRPDDASKEGDNETAPADPDGTGKAASNETVSRSSSSETETDVFAEVSGISSGELKSGVGANQLQCTANKIKFIKGDTVEKEIPHAAITDIDTEADYSVEGFRRIGNAFLLPGILFAIISLYSSIGTISLLNELIYLCYIGTILSVLTGLYFRRLDGGKIICMSITTSQKEHTFFGDGSDNRFKKIEKYIKDEYNILPEETVRKNS